MKDGTFGISLAKAIAVAIAVFVLALIGFGLYESFSPSGLEKQQERQEQRFANQFYDSCKKAGGTYSAGWTGYVCFGNGGILFQSESGDSVTVR
jgi:hypothetical protein